MPSLRLTVSIPAALVALTMSVVSLTASAQDLPSRKAGLWQMTTNSTTGKTKSPEMVIQQCVDAATDKKMQQLATGMAGQMKCSLMETTKAGDKIGGHTVCQMGASKVDVRTITTGDFSKEYTTQSASTFDPPMAGISTSTSVASAKWIGPCKADQKPGDVIMPNGQKINLAGAK